MRRITRTQAIEDLRAVLLGRIDEGNSLCRVVSREGIFCRGFSRWTARELERRFPWVVRREPDLGREHLELEANSWQLGAQDQSTGRLPCDVHAGNAAHSPCAGWDGFDERELARFHEELCGEAVRVVPDGATGPEPGPPSEGARAR